MANHYKKIRLSRFKTIDEHRFIMEKHLGRKLRADEIVHHKDENKRNNSIENLQVMALGAHSKMHMKGEIRPSREKLQEFGRKNRTQAKLTPEDVLAIRERLSRRERATDIAEEYHVHKTQISKIKNNITWAWV